MQASTSALLGKTRRMSTLPPPPPDRPTEPLRPIRPEPAPVVHERVVAPAGVDTTSMLLALEDAVGALRTWLAIVGLIAVAALGVAIYSLTKDDGNTSSSRAGLASDERVSRVDDRVDRLSRQVQSLRASRSPSSSSGADTSALSDRIDQIESTLKTLAARPAGADSTQAIKDLSERIDTLQGDVDQLKQDASAAP